MHHSNRDQPARKESKVKREIRALLANRECLEGRELKVWHLPMQSSVKVIPYIHQDHQGHPVLMVPQEQKGFKVKKAKEASMVQPESKYEIDCLFQRIVCIFSTI